MSDGPHSTLTVLGSGAYDGTGLELGPGQEVVIGSDADCTFCIALPGVSPIHARLWIDDDGTTLFDAGSPRGLYRNDDPVSEQVALGDGDIVWLGPPGDAESVMLQYRVVPAEAVAEVEPEPVEAEPVVEAEVVSVEPEVEAGEAAALDEALSDPDAFVVEEGEALSFAPEPEPVVEEAESSAPEPEPAEPEPPPAEPPPEAYDAGEEISLGGTPPEPPPAPAPKPPAAKPAPAPKPAAKPVTSRVAAPVPRKSSGARNAVLGVVGLAILAGGGYFGWNYMKTPELLAASPTRVRAGQTVTLTGKNFAAEGTRVLFGSAAGDVRQASETGLQVVVPALPSAPGRDTPVAVSVEVGGRASQSLQVAVYAPPLVKTIEPVAGLPGDEVTLHGAGFTKDAQVRFGDAVAEILEPKPDALRVRVPEIAADPGKPVAVTVSVGSDRSEPAQLWLGRLPLILAIEPAQAGPGDVVTVTGLGFATAAPANAVVIARTEALVLSAAAEKLEVAVPRLPHAGEVPVELRVADREGVGTASLAVPDTGTEGLRFIIEPLVDAAGHEHALISTWLGPAFALSDTAEQNASERARTAQRLLSAAAQKFADAEDPCFEAKSTPGGAAVFFAGQAEPVLTATAQDVATYTEERTGLGAAGALTPERLALWWQAVASDLALIGRGVRPHNAADLAPDGRALVAAGQALGGPITAAAAGKLTAGQRDALRKVALRVPAGVPEPQLAAAAAAAPAGGTAAPSAAAPSTAAPAAPASTAPAATTAPAPAAAPSTTLAAAPATTAPPTTVPAGPALELEGHWGGKEVESGMPKFIAVTFQGQGKGSFAYQTGVSISTPLKSVKQPTPDSVVFSVGSPRGTMYYRGSFDGKTITGTVSLDPKGGKALGTFELTRQ